MISSLFGLVCSIAAVQAYNPLNLPLTQAGVVPNTLPDFTPRTFPVLVFPSGAVAFEGNSISIADATYAPAVSFVGDGQSLYTLAIVDNDAPERSNNLISEVQHFLAFNIPSYTINANLSTLGDKPTGSAGFLSPAPPPGCGPHRYVVALFKQPSRIDATTVGLGTDHYPLFFNLKSYAASLNLTLVAANFWRTPAVAAPYCTFFTDSSETTVSPTYVAAYGVSPDASLYARSPN